MKGLSFLLYFFVAVLIFSFSVLSEEDEVVFELKREEEKKSEQKQIKRKKPLPPRFKRHSFTFSKDFVIYNKRPKSHLKPGTALKVNIPYPVIASFSEEFPIFGIVISPFSGIVSGKIKAVKNTNRAFIVFDEIVFNGEVRAIQSFPLFLEGDLKETFLKDLLLNFFESLPSALTLALGPKIPQSQVHFINTDLKNKMGKFSSLKQEEKRRLQYLEIRDIQILRVAVK